MSANEIIVGIDLGTTNSEIAAFVGDGPEVLGPNPDKMLPSCVGISPSGELLVGESARNQLLIYPEQTVHSVKRKMGGDETIHLGEKTFSPPEISALILRELVEWGQHQLNQPIRKAVITVPAYFSDAQRQATREAGELAGLQVVRILNEPTAASLAYGFQDQSRRTVMVYDLGGGTFDVSIVSIEGDVTEVLASHGNNHLGGNDFDQLLLDRLLQEFQDRHGLNLKDYHPASYSRLRWAAEQAKKKLSFDTHVFIREEALAFDNGKPLHLDLELSLQEYESMISSLVESTLDSVSQAMNDANKHAGQIDAVLLVGGSTRTPLIWHVLEERIGRPPRQDIHPDLCVALGAGLLASRLAGHHIERILVDVSPYSFGPSYLGDLNQQIYPYCYRPIIRRNTPLPVTRTESYYTAAPYQTTVEIQIFQGDNSDALKNIPVGNFLIEDLTPTPQPNEVMCQMHLDLDGILKVTAIEKITGKSKYITIRNALKPKSPEEMAAAQKKLKNLYAERASDLQDVPDQNLPVDDLGQDFSVDMNDPPDQENEIALNNFEKTLKLDPDLIAMYQEANNLMTRSRQLLSDVHDEDKEEIINLHELIEDAVGRRDKHSLSDSMSELKELLFFIEGK